MHARLATMLQHLAHRSVLVRRNCASLQVLWSGTDSVLWHAQAASAEAPEAVPAGGHQQVSRTLHIQATKVVAAHAATIGDALLAVPLLCSAGAPGREVMQFVARQGIACAVTMHGE